MHVSPSISPLLQTAIATAPHNCSPLNPNVHIQRNTVPALTTTKIHLSNLEKLLQKPLPTASTPDVDVIKQTTSNIRRNATPLSLSIDQSSDDRVQAEAMSPRSLKHLQRLLSSDSEPSPRGDISQNWRKYHGCNNWFGLLNPLNPHLRREILRYGDHVQSAYNAYYSHPSTSISNQVSLTDQTYRVTSSLFATSSVQLPQWLSSVAPWVSTQRSSWIGYVAVCDDEREIRRMGRRDIAIVLRGTATCLEWAENFRAGLVLIEPGAANDGAKVECGFWSLYKTPGDKLKSLSSSVVAEVQRLLKKYKGEELSITVTGHSLGAALSVLVADELSTCVAPQDTPPISVISFGSPRVGNRAFVNRIESRGVKVLRVVNVHDMVTRIPGLMHREDAQKGGWQERLFEKFDGYVHVGRELQIDSRMSPFLRPDADPACCHDLEAYLHLVDGFLAANCPFRANAKRSLVRLVNQQGGNIKQVFMSKARAVQLDRSAPAGKTATIDEPSLHTVCSERLSQPSTASVFLQQRLIESK